MEIWSLKYKKNDQIWWICVLNLAHFSILRPAESFIFNTAARRDIFHQNVAPRWIWVWDSNLISFAMEGLLAIDVKWRTKLLHYRVSKYFKVKVSKSVFILRNLNSFKVDYSYLEIRSQSFKVNFSYFEIQIYRTLLFIFVSFESFLLLHLIKAEQFFDQGCQIWKITPFP